MRGVEQDLVTEMKDPVLWEAMAIVYGGGLENISSGMDVVKGFQRRYVNEYIARMRWVGIDKTLDNLVPELASYANHNGTPETSPTA